MKSIFRYTFSMAKKILKLFSIILSLTTNYYLLTTNSYGLESPRFRIEQEKIQIDVQKSSEDTYTIAQTWDEETYRTFLQKGYAVKNESTFGSSISHGLLKFASIGKQKVFTDSIKIEVFPSEFAYEVTVLQEYPLRGSSKNTISNTRCDNENAPCNISLAKRWSSDRSYGFGYSLSGDDIPNDFLSQDFYRVFPNDSSDQPSMTIMSAIHAESKRESHMRFKLNIAPSIPEGTYETIIDFVALPDY